MVWEQIGSVVSLDVLYGGRVHQNADALIWKHLRRSDKKDQIAISEVKQLVEDHPQPLMLMLERWWVQDFVHA